MKSLLALALAVVALAGANAQAFTFVTVPTAQDSAGEAVNAKAVFTAGNGTLTIDIYNMLTAAQMKSVGQDISDIFFKLNQGDNSGTVGLSTANFVTVKNKVGTYAASAATGDNIGWALHNTAGVFHLDGLNDAADVPAHTILGGGTADLNYSGANNSINNNKPHNPFVLGVGHWVLDINGVTANTKVSDVVFSFGTTPGDNVRSVPEPASMAVLAIGALALRRRKLAK